ncbi:MAG: hypothetical protein ACE14M_14835 [Terriglobales bacterium]
MFPSSRKTVLAIGSPWVRRANARNDVGDAVNTSARLMANAAGGQILISESTAIELGSEFGLSVLPPLKVKGKSQPVHVSAVNWAQAERAVGNA